MNGSNEGGRLPEGVVLLHGFGGLPVQTALLATRLRRAGYKLLNPLYPSWRWPIERIVERLHPRISHFAMQVGTLHGVGHSMGGLVLRALLTHHRPDKLGRIVMLGTPNRGSEMADLAYRWRLHRPILNQAGQLLRTMRPPEIEALLGTVDYPLGVIAGNRALNPLLADCILPLPHDGKVSVAATHVGPERSYHHAGRPHCNDLQPPRRGPDRPFPAPRSVQP